jgi:DNA helicase-2/ATP-dependent DNA helicase PcrA
VTEYTPGQLARVLRVPEPTTEQAAVIGAPLGPLAVIAGAGSGKSETMAARLVWLVANGLVRPDRARPDVHEEGGCRARRSGSRAP